VTATGYQLPRLRPDVVLGPALRSGPDVVHHVKDAATGTYYRIGQREQFILRRMDGAHTLEDINAEYLGHYDRRLGDDSWRQIFTLLGQRQLLDGFTDPAALARLKAATEAKRAVRNSWAQRRWVLLHPDEVCTRLDRRLGFAFGRAFAVPALLAVLALEVFVWWHAGTLAADAAHRTWWPVTVGLSLLLLLVIAALHELGHGVACKHYGGEVTEIGFRWRFPMIDPYCRTDDIVLFHRRSARVVTAFAGSFVTLLALLPVLAAWALTPGWQLGHSIAAGLLLFGSFGTIANLAPFLQLDGYAMLGHALDLADLRRECLTFWRLRLGRQTPERAQRVRAYSVRDRRIYTGYGISTVLVFGAGYVALTWFWFHSLRRWMAAPYAVAILASETVLVVVLLGFAARTRSARTAAAKAAGNSAAGVPAVAGPAVAGPAVAVPAATVPAAEVPAVGVPAAPAAGLRHG
jgi:putative peptide zinc metalloprotease protein